MATLLKNKKASFNYELLDEYEAGIELLGHEVKSLRNKMGSLEGAYITVSERGVFLVNATIPPYQPKNAPPEYDQNRPRRLLLSKKEIARLIGKESTKGLTIVPISLYGKGRFIKLRIAVARGKKKHDKRETIKKREDERQIERTLKGE